MECSGFDRSGTIENNFLALQFGGNCTCNERTYMGKDTVLGKY